MTGALLVALGSGAMLGLVLIALNKLFGVREFWRTGWFAAYLACAGTALASWAAFLWLAVQAG